jgi:hypothetical protein
VKGFARIYQLVESTNYLKSNLNPFSQFSSQLALHTHHFVYNQSTLTESQSSYFGYLHGKLTCFRLTHMASLQTSRRHVTLLGSPGHIDLSVFLLLFRFKDCSIKQIYKNRSLGCRYIAGNGYVSCYKLSSSPKTIQRIYNVSLLQCLTHWNHDRTHHQIMRDVNSSPNHTHAQSVGPREAEE